MCVYGSWGGMKWLCLTRVVGGMVCTNMCMHMYVCVYVYVYVCVYVDVDGMHVVFMGV